VRDVLVGGGEQLLIGVAEHGAKRFVHLQPAAGRQDEGHADRCMAEGLREAPLAFLQACFQDMPSGDVGEKNGDTANRAVIVDVRGERGLGIALAVVPAYFAIGDDRLTGERGGHAWLDAGVYRRRDDFIQTASDESISFDAHPGGIRGTGEAIAQ
jgi:hypothetical protein